MNRSIYILTGGKSSRMGTDKGLLVFNGISLIERLCQIVVNLDFEPIILASDKSYDRFGYQRIDDVYLGKGPLAGIHAALNHSNDTGTFILNVDIPFIKEKEVLDLVSRAVELNKINYISSPNNKHYLLGYYPKEAISLIENQLESNDYSIRSLLKVIDHVEIIVGSDEPYLNFNDPKDLNGSVHLVNYFGMLSEVRKIQSEYIFIPNEEKKDLKKFFKNSFPSFEKYQFQIAIDKQMVNEIEEQKITNEIALLPAFAGG